MSPVGRAAADARVNAFVGIVGVLALSILVANVSILLNDPPPFSWMALTWGVTFLVLFVFLETTAVTLWWRGHRTTISLVEVALVPAFLALPPTLVVLLGASGMAAYNLASRRAPVKAVFNVARSTVALSAGALVMLVAPAAGALTLLVAILATVVFSLLNDVIVATVFAVMEDVPAMRVYRERFMRPTLLGLAMGVPTALAIVALWNLHPAATLAVVPLALLLQHAARLQAGADRENAVRRRLAEEGFRLIGVTDRAALAETVLATCRELFDAGRVRLETASGAWEVQSPEGAAPDAGMTAALRGTGGSLRVWPRPLKRAYGDEDRALLDVVAGFAAHAFGNAAATEQVAAQRDLIARQDKLSTLGTMLTGVAHEIANPLGFMRVRLAAEKKATERLLANPASSADLVAYARSARDAHATLERGVERLAALTHSLKATAKPGDGTRAPTQVNEVAREVVTVVRAGASHLTWDVDLDATAPVVIANAAELHQVVLNLVKNATEAVDGRSDPRVHVRTRRAGAGVELVVADNGPGMPPEVRAKLFTPFFTTKAAGTGIGLSISHQIVAAHAGTITCESGPTGTTFVVRLPTIPGTPAGVADGLAGAARSA